ncbi:Sin-like protein conserved region-domain-containing protein [Rhodotorula diobovata]|uniref:Sin-like protein conserved region-domain-containing protein n=1 Tax=Rhodotorula diobovata TaxID=5288 RepID=A0A5C5G052_9BASI|nr:Sin-like protein conserved region-domain-containing protein [Rhodotorula diobovata]
MADQYEEIHPTPIASTSRPRKRKDTAADDGDADMRDPSSSNSGSDNNNDDGDDDDESDDEDDPIVRRLPVYYTPHFLESLCLLQYPDRPPHPDTAHPLVPPALRPDWPRDPTPSAGRLQAKYKPNTQHLELTLPMEKHPDRWNEDEAQKYAAGVVEDRDRQRERDLENQGKKGKGRRRRKDVQDDEEEQRYREEKESRRLDKMVFASTGVPEVTSYLVGVVKNDALHLNPVNQTFQLRPSLTYLDNLLAIERRNKRQAQQNDDDDESDVSDTELKKEAAKAVQVQVKQQLAQQQQNGGGGAAGGSQSAAAMVRGGNGRAGASLFDPLRAEEAEEWKPVKHFHANVRRPPRYLAVCASPC